MSSVESLADFTASLGARITGDLRTDSMTRALYATDASLYKIMPLAVLVPRSIDDVQAAIEEANRYEIPILARGGGSSLAGQTVGAALVIDFSRYLDDVLELNLEEQWVRVRPGLVLDHLSEQLRPHGLMVGPDPASSNRATLGGMMANNATGTHSLMYGNVIRHIKEAEVLLSDGSAAHFSGLSPDAFRSRGQMNGLEGRIYAQIDRLLSEKEEVIRRDTPRHWRRNSGYRLEYLLDEKERNLAQLICGSEGTLAVVTSLTLSLVPSPKKTALGVVHFRTRRESLLAVTTILRTNPSAIELFDGVAIEQARKAPGFAKQLTFITGDPGSVLITEYYGESETELEGKLDELDRILRETGHGYAVVRAVTPSQIKNVWNVRKEGLGLIMGVKGDYVPVAFIEDASVPVEHLADYIDGLEEIFERTGTHAAMYAHASAGTLHVRPFINTKDAAEVQKMREISWASMELVRKYGGAVSSEHGDGLARSWLNEPLLGRELYDVYRQVKAIFDPLGILNPGKKVDAPSMTENLRYGPNYRTIPVHEKMDFSDAGGFAAAVELCNGNGACRKMLTGTMCPSFMVTREEEHSTRGRANALRAAMSGMLPPEEFTSERMYQVLELCVQCKGCKAECPSNVDMAKIKTEWLSKYWAANKMPLRTRLFANMPKLARRLSGKPAGVVNWVNRQRPVLKVLEKTMGISEKRSLPPFAAEPFSRWFQKQTWPTDGPEVVLFADTFYNYNHPEVARAAAMFLAATGHHVIVLEDNGCCGRTLLSKGLVDEAQQLALTTTDKLYPYVEKGLPIVGLEPSCILTFRDEYLSLLPGDLRVKQLASQTLTFEEYVARRADEGAFKDTRWKESGAVDVLLHGHCHQKALVGTGPAEACLSLPGYRVTTVDSGCCGMAGAFGYEKEHYDISIAMAERRLAPAVRAASSDTLIAAAGTSCRAQIHDTTGRAALHPAEILLDALAD